MLLLCLRNALKENHWLLFFLFNGANGGGGSAVEMQRYGLIRFPVSARKIGYVDRSGLFLCRANAKRHNSAPGSRIIDILVEGKSVAQAIDESPVHDKIHSSVPTHFFGNGSDMFDQWKGVFLFEFFLLLWF